MGRGDHMDVIWHEAVGLDADSVVTRVRLEHRKVKAAIGVAEEDPLTVVAAMADVVRESGEHEPFGVGHQQDSADGGQKISLEWRKYYGRPYLAKQPGG